MPDRILAVIPARLASTRLPRKVLRPIAGRPLLLWTVDAARRSPRFADVLVAADSPEVMDLCQAHGISAVLTPPELPSGTDRLHAIMDAHPADIYANVQADEPMLTPSHFEDLLAPFALPAVDVTTLKVRCRVEDLENPNAVKVVAAPSGRALYFSRARIPFDRDGTGAPVFKHLGLYAYRADALRRFATFAPSPLELTERLEQLRLLENGIGLYVSETAYDTVGVDTEADLLRVEELMTQNSRPNS